MKESVINIAIEEELRMLEANSIIDAMFDKQKTKNIKAHLIALEVKSHALLS